MGFSLRKVNRHVDFPLVLDLAPFCSSMAQVLAPLSLYCESIDDRRVILKFTQSCWGRGEAKVRGLAGAGEVLSNETLKNYLRQIEELCVARASLRFCDNCTLL